MSAAAANAELLCLDVDGVMTDGGVYLGTSGDQRVELKRFDIQDTIGIRFLKEAGIKVFVVSGRQSAATTIRAEELGVDALVQDDRARKLPALEGLLHDWGIRIEDAAFVGDDLPDLPVLRRVGLPIAVSNSTAEVRGVAQFITRAAGGRGAVREVAELLLRARGQWDELVDRYAAERGDAGPRMGRARR